MELNEFAANYPELYAMLDEDVRYYVVENNMTGEESLRAWDNMVDNIVNKYEQGNYFGYNTEEVLPQQIPFDGFRGRDFDFRFRRRRRRFRDFNIRDIIRLLFLRQLFDRRRRFF
ncbi:hypothetical protein [Sedimentibacter sp.]|uniref:hypothetical protein n=1 Tax=Sedimentibacter sp. TaxID=1960295 RepID=UPI0028A86884|nr:hypothetical protein [Sedimentibacter sp.]